LLLPELLRRLSLLRARSLCAELLRLLACAPMRPASERLILPLEERDGEDEEDLRDAIDHSLFVVGPLCGAGIASAVGANCRLL
jgi:hypothetical protein